MSVLRDESINRGISAKIKTLGFFMTCAMVCYHCPGFDNVYAIGKLDANINSLIAYFFQQMGFVVMSHFFAVTGYLLFKDFKMKDYPAKIKRRLFSLLIPYILWQCIIAVIDTIQKQYVFSLTDFLRRTFCLEMWPLDGALWYVYAIFLLALISPILLLLFRNKHVGWLATLMLIIAIQCKSKITNPYVVAILSHGYIGNILFYLPCYLVGSYCGRFSEENTKNESLTCILTVVFTSFVLNEVFPGFFNQMTIGLMPLMGLYVLPVVPAFQNKRIYDLSFLIYAIHQPLITDTWRIFRSGFFMEIPMPVSVRSILVRVNVLVLDIVIAFLIHVVLKRFSPKLLGAITGGRFSRRDNYK